uniref:Uncharacterized protein n=1 Tax=Glossina austeni TaxID=7395 RepID=A0A1A9UYW7_GLOAU
MLRKVTKISSNEFLTSPTSKTKRMCCLKVLLLYASKYKIQDSEVTEGFGGTHTPRIFFSLVPPFNYTNAVQKAPLLFYSFANIEILSFLNIFQLILDCNALS